VIGPTRRSRHGSRKAERILGIVAIVAIIAAWIIGFVRGEADVLASLAEAVPEAERFESLGASTYAAWAGRSDEDLLGYVNIASSMGYGGPMRIAVAGDTQGKVTGYCQGGAYPHTELSSFCVRVCGE